MDNLPEGWESSIVDNVATKIHYGYTGRAIEKGDFKYLRITDIQNSAVEWEQVPFVSITDKEVERYKLNKNDIVFARTGATAGKSFLISSLDVNSVFASYLIRIIPDVEKIYPRFLYQYFQSPEYWSYITSNVEGAAQPNFNGKKLANIPIPLPPLTEQKRIVSKLDALFERIDKSMDLLEENIKHTESLMASALDEVFGNGDIPIKDVCVVNPKKSEVKDKNDELLVSFLPMKELNENDKNFTPSSLKKLSEVYKGYTYFKDSDVLLAKVTPCFQNGKAGVCKNLKNSIGFGSSEFHVIRSNGKLLPEWIYYSILNRRFIEEGVKSMTGSSGLKRVPAKFVENWKIKVPDYKKQKRTIENINIIFDKLQLAKTEQQDKLTNLKSLKESILDKAFKGEL